MIIMGVDGGLATGIATYNTETGDLVDMCETPDSSKGFAPIFNGLVLAHEPDLIVFEKFVLRSGNDFLANLSTVEVNGWAKGQGHYKHDLLPATHKPFNGLGDGAPKGDSPITKWMKEQGWKIGKGHTRDAASIALYWACKKLKDPDSIALHQRLSKEK